MAINLKCNSCDLIKYHRCSSNENLSVNKQSSSSSGLIFNRRCFLTIHLTNYLWCFIVTLFIVISRVHSENVISQSTVSKTDDVSPHLSIQQSLHWESLRKTKVRKNTTPSIIASESSSFVDSDVHVNSPGRRSIASNNLLMASSDLIDSQSLLHTVSSPFRSTAPYTRVTINTLPSIDNREASRSITHRHSKSQNTSPMSSINSNYKDTSLDTVQFLSNIFTSQAYLSSSVDDSTVTSPLPWTPILSSPSSLVNVNTDGRSRRKESSDRRISKSMSISMVTASPVTATTRSKTSVSMSISSSNAPHTTTTTPSRSKSRTLNTRHNNNDASSSMSNNRWNNNVSVKPPSQLLSKIIQSAISPSKVRGKNKSSRNATHSRRSYNGDDDDEIIFNYHSSANASIYNMYYPENEFDNLHPSEPFTRIVENEKLPPYKLVWSDEFTDDQVNSKKWMKLIDCTGRGNEELQCYTEKSENAYIHNGVLNIQSLVETYVNKSITHNQSYTSGRLHSTGDGGWLYGLFEFRARLPKGKHLWPAIWMVPVNNIYGGWPVSGEIDIMEMRGQNSTSIESTVHFGASRSDKGKVGSSMIDFNTDFSLQYHVYSFEWTNDSMTWFLDGNEYWHLDLNQHFTTKQGTIVYNKTGSPFDHPFRIILNVAVGGKYFSRFGKLSIEDALSWEKPNMQVDWVRVYQRPVSNEKPTSSSSSSSFFNDISKKKTDLETVHTISTNLSSHTVQIHTKQTNSSSIQTNQIISTVPIDISQSRELLNNSTATVTTTLSALSVSPTSQSSNTFTTTTDGHLTSLSDSDQSQTQVMRTREQLQPETSTSSLLIDAVKHQHNSQEEIQSSVKGMINVNTTSSNASTTTTTSTLDATTPVKSIELSTQPSSTLSTTVIPVTGNDEKKMNEVINYEYDSTEEKIDSPLITYYYYQEDP